MVAQILFQQLLTLFLLLIAGYILAKRKLLDKNSIKGLTHLLTKVMLPAMAISSLQIPYAQENLSNMGLAAAGLLVFTLVGILLAWALRVPFRRVTKSEAGIWMCCCGFSNFVYIGKPLMEALYGSSVLFLVSAMSITFNLFCFSFGVFLIDPARDRSTGSVKSFLRLLCNPMIIGGAIALLLYFFSIRLPAPVIAALNMLTGALTPLSMIVIGASLVGISLRDMFLDWKVYALTAIRLICCPLLAYLLFRGFVQDEMLRNILLIAAAMPVATAIVMLAEQYDNPHAVLCSKVTVMTTVLCMGTIPLLFLALGL